MITIKTEFQVSGSQSQVDLAGNRLASSSTGTNQVLFISGSSSEPIGTDNRWGELWVSNLTASAGTVPGVSREDFFAELPAAENTTNTIVAAIRDMAGNVGYATNNLWVGDFTTEGTESQSFGYDAAGCLTNLNGTALEWDERYSLLIALGEAEGDLVNPSLLPREQDYVNIIYELNQRIRQLKAESGLHIEHKVKE